MGGLRQLWGSGFRGRCAGRSVPGGSIIRGDFEGGAGVRERGWGDGAGV